MLWPMCVDGRAVTLRWFHVVLMRLVVLSLPTGATMTNFGKDKYVHLRTTFELPSLANDASA